MWGTKNNYDYTSVARSKEVLRQSVLNDDRSFYWDIDEENQLLNGYTNVYGTLNIQWAKYSDTWADVPYVRQTDLIKFLQAGLLRYMGELLAKTSTDVPAAMEPTDMISRAEELESDILERWRLHLKPVMIRG
jgi:hypothetical protein